MRKEIEKWFGCYGTRGDLFTQESNRHPAKMAVQLCFRIFEHGQRRGYWKPGDVILDPMAGIGTTLVCGLSLGYHVVGVELETHFCKMAQENLRLAFERIGQAGDLWWELFDPDGVRWWDDKRSWTLFRGDARNLGSILNLDGALTSPPYGDQQVTGAGHFKSRWEPDQKEARSNPREGYADSAVASPPYPGETGGESGINQGLEKKPSGPNAQHRLPRTYDAAIGSPPYGDTKMPVSIRSEIRQLYRSGKFREAIAEYRKNQERQVELGQKFGVDSDETIIRRLEECMERDEGNYSAVVTSPPYLEAKDGRGIAVDGVASQPGRRGKVGDRSYTPETVAGAVSSPPYPVPEGGGKGNEARPGDVHPKLRSRQYTPPNINAAVSSPPYSDSISTENQRGRGHNAELNEKMGISHNVYGKGGLQIGNLKDPKDDIDAVLSSPPYGETHVGNPGEQELAAQGRAKEIGTSATGHGGKGRHGFQYSHDTEAQIGNANGETYLSAMALVYREMWKVLKPAAVVCLVTKNPVKNGAIRRLDEDTICLMEAAGFELIERVQAMLAEDLGEQSGFELSFETEDKDGKPLTVPIGKHKRIKIERKSFFKRLFEKKRPDLRVDHEDYLFFRKVST